MRLLLLLVGAMLKSGITRKDNENDLVKLIIIDTLGLVVVVIDP